MKSRPEGLIWIGLGISLFLALFLSPLASSSPDGLEKVAETRGFAEKGEGWNLWKYAPFSDYAVPWIKNEKVSTALSGLIGTLAIFFIILGLGKLIKKPPTKQILIITPFYCFIFLTSTSLYAARPLTTDDAWTVEKGRFQMEFGFDISRQDNHDRELSPSLTLTYGLLEKMDLGIGSGYIFLDPKEDGKENGFADTEVKAKYRFFDEENWIPAFAISGILKIPTASESKGLGSGQADFGMNAIVTKNISKRLALHLNLGYTLIGENHMDNELNYSMGGQFSLTDRWAVVGEIVGVNNLNGHIGDDPLSFLIGTYSLLTDHVILDGGLEVGASKAAPDFRFTTGLTWVFKP
jgi:cobalt/nickel transport protein